MKKTQIQYYNNEMLIEEYNCILSLSYDSVIYIQYKRPYVIISLFSGREHYVYNSLSYFDNQLPLAFFTCNQSIIVNLLEVYSIKKEDRNFLLFMKDGRSISVSRNNRKALLERYYFIKKESLGCSKCLFCKQHNNCPLKEQDKCSLFNTIT